MDLDAKKIEKTDRNNILMDSFSSTTVYDRICYIYNINASWTLKCDISWGKQDSAHSPLHFDTYVAYLICT